MPGAGAVPAAEAALAARRDGRPVGHDAGNVRVGAVEEEAEVERQDDGLADDVHLDVAGAVEPQPLAEVAAEERAAGPRRDDQDADKHGRVAGAQHELVLEVLGEEGGHPGEQEAVHGGGHAHAHVGGVADQLQQGLGQVPQVPVVLHLLLVSLLLLREVLARHFRGEEGEQERADVAEGERDFILRLDLLQMLFLLINMI